MKFSKQRNLILNTVLNSDNHITADEIYYKLKANHPELSLGTVYRNLSKLSEIGLIKKVNIPNQSDKFDKNLSRHTHLVCSDCNKIYDIELESIDCIIKNISGDNNILINSYNIIFEGICSNCKNDNLSD